ncbi:MAG: alkaline phosphatase family protein, partial [Gammaproteobacteria bacterium]|nr:alkaline phosphatase family protein [Gammaproteobacteria bacterium]
KRSTYLAETLWEAACREGRKCATLDFPGGDTRQHPNHLWVAERGSPAGVTPYAVRNLGCLATEGLHLRDAQLLEKKGAEYSAEVKPAYLPGSGPRLTFRFSTDQQGHAGVWVSGFDQKGSQLLLLPGQASPWLWSEFSLDGQIVLASYRLELTQLNQACGEFAVVVSQVTAPPDIADPPEMGHLLVERLGPYIGYDGARGVDRNWLSPDHMVADGRYKGLWQAGAARLLVQEFGYDLVLFKWHLIDHVQHSFWGGIDPLSPWYENADRALSEKLIRGAYQAADEMIGLLLPLLDEGVTIGVVSDHGHLPHLKAINWNNLFVKAGLIQLLPGDENPPRVDWPNTQIYGGPALGHIWVNQKKRQPQGCVDAQEFEAVRQKVIDLMVNLVDPATNQKVIDKVFRHEETRFMGLWGERTGDIVYWMRPGYSGDFNWSPIWRDGAVVMDLLEKRPGFADYGEGRFVGDKFQSVHGCGDPSAQLGVGTEEAVFALAGPAVKPGAKLKDVPNLTCVVPSLCAASGLPLPAQNEGDALGEWLR